MLRLSSSVRDQLVAHALDGAPEEACGLLAGPPGGDDVVRFYPCRNKAASTKIYELHPLDHLHADRDAETQGLEIVGVMHSHTHTPAYPSPTDVAQAPDPGWHYLIVSLQHAEPDVRSFRIVDGAIEEEPVTLEPL